MKLNTGKKRRLNTRKEVKKNKYKSSRQMNAEKVGRNRRKLRHLKEIIKEKIKDRKKKKERRKKASTREVENLNSSVLSNLPFRDKPQFSPNNYKFCSLHRKSHFTVGQDNFSFLNSVNIF